MKREIIELSDYEIAPILYEDALLEKEYDSIFDENTGDLIKNDYIFQNFENIRSKIIEADIDFEYIEIEVIVKRVLDGKFFKGYYTITKKYGNSYHNFLTEVFPQEKNIIIYT